MREDHDWQRQPWEAHLSALDRRTRAALASYDASLAAGPEGERARWCPDYCPEEEAEEK
jgi:hypothetical protein